jgi:hypothetical protein
MRGYLAVDDDRLSREHEQRLFDRLEALGKVGAILGKDGDVLYVFVQLHAVAIEFYFVQPAVASRRPLAADWDDGRMNGERRNTQRDVESYACSCKIAARRSRYLKRGPPHSSSRKSTALEPRGKYDALISARERRALRYALPCNTHPMRTQFMRRARSIRCTLNSHGRSGDIDYLVLGGSVPAQRGHC